MGKYSEKETKNEEKISSILLILFPIFSLGIAKAETIKIVSDTAYAPFEFKDSDQTYKGIDVDIINKVAEIKGWNIQMPILDLMQRSMRFKLVKLTLSWQG